MPDWKRPSESDCGYVEVLTTHHTGAVYGHRLVGATAGPQVLIAAFCPSAEQVFPTHSFHSNAALDARHSFARSLGPPG